MPFHCSNTFYGSHFLPGLQFSVWPSSFFRTCLALSLPSPSHAFPFPTLSTVLPPGLFPSSRIYSTLSPSPGCPTLSFSNPMHPSPSISLMKLLWVPWLQKHYYISVWTMHPAIQLYIFLSSNCFIYVYLVSQLYFDLHESRACLLPLCSLQKQCSTEAYLSEPLLGASSRWAHVEREDGGKWGFQAWGKEKMVWVSSMVIITQDYIVSYHCPFPPNRAHCWLLLTVHCIHCQLHPHI